jgi:excisionase family DNA binding protein
MSPRAGKSSPGLKLCRINVVYGVYCSAREGATLPDEPRREWLTVEEVATLFRVNIETVRRWFRAGALPALNVGGPRSGYRIRRADLATFITARYRAGKDSSRVAMTVAHETAR